jgi:predicted molibdopterin-dependent oxidoreductase YjgC
MMPKEETAMIVRIDGVPIQTSEGELLVDVIRCERIPLPHVCYHPQLGPIRTCDTCMVEIDAGFNAELVRACDTRIPSHPLTVLTNSHTAKSAREAAFDRILANHRLYCMVCDNNNGNCTVHNDAELIGIKKQNIPWQPKPGARIDSNAFYRYDPDQCIHRVPGIHRNAPDTFVELSQQLATERGVRTGSWVRLESRRGHVRVQALVTDCVSGNELYMPMNSTTSPVNLLTGSHTDPGTHTPAYKETAVRMQVLGEEGESPLPRRNSRFGHPTPQRGVEVERKWKRENP